MSAPTAQTLLGRVTVHPRGFGFVTATEPDARTGETRSAFVAPPELNRFLADDLVHAEVTQAPDGRWSAAGLVLVRRTRSELTGEVVQHRGQPHLKCDREVANTDWPLEIPDGVTLNNGDPVVARVEAEPARAVYLESLAKSTDADRALVRVMTRYGLRRHFPEEALAQAREITARASSVGELVAKGLRRDLRAVPTVTIDAPSTRDIDDALSVLPPHDDGDGALRLLVSIADPSEYIPEGSPLDREARARGTSTYLAGRVLPMLPDELSSECLSLLPNTERATLTAELRIDPEGHVTAVDVYESVIRSWARLTYTEVAAFLDRGEISPAMEPIRKVSGWFRAVGARLSVARARRGGVVFAREEARVVVDASGEASAVVNERTTSAHTLVERCMVAANEAIARWLVHRGVPAVFRVHDVPDPTRVADFALFARSAGYDAGFGRALSPLALSAFDLQIQGTPSEPALRAGMLRELGPARYTVKPAQHFGLAAPLYLHFTSPLRRYADFAVHRTLKAYLRGQRAFTPDDPTVEALSLSLNDSARASSRAENDRRKMLLAGYLARRVGEEFAGTVTRARPFGLLVQLDETLAEGVVPTETLPGGPWEPDARETSLVGSTKSIPVGERVRVRVVRADATLGRVEFALVVPASA